MHNVDVVFPPVMSYVLFPQNNINSKHRNTGTYLHIKINDVLWQCMYVICTVHAVSFSHHSTVRVNTLCGPYVFENVKNVDITDISNLKWKEF
jgi:hypothetical protein